MPPPFGWRFPCGWAESGPGASAYVFWFIAPGCRRAQGDVGRVRHDTRLPHADREHMESGPLSVGVPHTSARHSPFDVAERPLQPRMSVLGIGISTGYNAALLAHLTGDPALVATIDIDPSLAGLARSQAAQVVGAGMEVVTGDGRRGVPERGPYARIIATASSFPVPPAWIEQLAPGGLLVLDLRGQIGGGLMVVEKQEDGIAQGRF